MRGDPDQAAEGVIIEAQLDPKQGPVANVLVKQGSLKVGGYVVAGQHMGKVRSMRDGDNKVHHRDVSGPLLALH